MFRKGNYIFQLEKHINRFSVSEISQKIAIKQTAKMRRGDKR